MSLFTMRTSHKELFITLSVVIFFIAIGSFFAHQTWISAVQDQDRVLLTRVKTIASLVNADTFGANAGLPESNTEGWYFELKDTLIQVRAANPDVRFVYVLQKVDDNVIFVADSEPVDSIDMSPGGQVYTEATQGIHDLFINKGSYIDPAYTDRWGTWVSGLAYFTAKNDPSRAYVIGMDIDAQVYTSAPFVKVFPIILMVIIATVLTMTTYWGRRKEQSLIELQQQFVSLASHELRSPLTAIRWQAEAALAETQYPKEVHDIFTHIHNSCLSVLDTVNDLLTFASVQQSLVRQGQFEKVDCSGLIDQVCEAVSVSAASKKITITKTTTPNMFVHVDAPRLVTVFTNIVTNAIKYSPEETSVTVSVTHNSTKNTAVVTIMDSGIGIPSDEQAQVLSGFYRATNARTKVHAGTGIGLYISKKIIEAHKGSLEIISPNVGSDRGTTVVVSLPLAR